MLALEPDAVLALEPGIVLHSLPEQEWFFAFNIKTGDQFRLNRTSYWVLETIGEGIQFTQLENSFSETFEVPRQTGKGDLQHLVEKLYQQKIIGRQNHG